jgi:hypothetical protein
MTNIGVDTTTNSPNKQYDIFLSYEKDIEKKVLRLYNILADKYLLKIWLDIIEISPGDNVFTKTVDAINSSKLMICCVTKSYPETSKCKNDITIAYTNDRNILVLMMEMLTAEELVPISYAVSNAQRINLFDDPSSHSWSGDTMDKILNIIGSVIGRKLHNRKPKNGLKKKVSSLVEARAKFPTTVVSNTLHSKDSGLEIATITTEEILFDKASKFFKEYESQQLQLKSPYLSILSLKKFRQTSLFQYVYGYNRMALLESKQRCIITSSYNQSVIITDLNGLWIERKNINKLLKQPWGICINSKDEIFIGDNEHKCIFVFDSSWKLLRKIAENISSGFFDLAFDPETNELYIANLFDSQILIVDSEIGKLSKKVYIDTPTYLRIVLDKLFVVNTDYIFCLDRKTFNVYQTIRLDDIDYIYGLYVDQLLNIYTTSHETDQSKKRSRDLNLYIIRSSDKHILKKVNIGLFQVNDIAFCQGRLLFLSDTHFDLFDYKGLNNEMLFDNNFKTIVEEATKKA